MKHAKRFLAGGILVFLLGALIMAMEAPKLGMIVGIFGFSVAAVSMIYGSWQDSYTEGMPGSGKGLRILWIGALTFTAGMLASEKSEVIGVGLMILGSIIILAGGVHGHISKD